MPRKSFEIDVKPEILTWARETIGKKIDEVAKNLKTTSDIITKWETGEKKPTKIQLEKLAYFYKRPFAVFFLPRPPAEPSLPKDFRTFPDQKKKPFSAEILLAIRRARRIQSLTKELKRNINNGFFLKIGKIDLSKSPEMIAIKIREIMKIETKIQFNWRNEQNAFEEWLRIIEEFGVLVLQLSLPLEEVRGFSLITGTPPVIVVNRRDFISGKIFSLFHEYAHLLLRNAGVCDMEEMDNRINNKLMQVEKFCNHLAGAILVPKDVLLNHQLVSSSEYFSNWPDEILEKIASDFKVSREVILRRLAIIQRTSESYYQKRRQEWQEKFREKQKIKKWGKSNPPKKCLQENGVLFTSLVLKKYKEEEITYRDVSDYLSIRLKYLPEIEKLAQSRSLLP